MKRTLVLDSFGAIGTIEGGSFKECHPADFDWTVCLAPETGLQGSVNIDVPDFGLPPDPVAYMQIVEEAVVRALRGESVYVGCMGGIGRTGTFLALMAKVCGVLNPVKYVRLSYNPHACETPEQERFVASQPVFWARVRVLARLWVQWPF